MTIPFSKDFLETLVVIENLMRCRVRLYCIGYWSVCPLISVIPPTLGTSFQQLSGFTAHICWRYAALRRVPRDALQRITQTSQWDSIAPGAHGRDRLPSAARSRSRSQPKPIEAEFIGICVNFGGDARRCTGAAYVSFYETDYSTTL